MLVTKDTWLKDLFFAGVLIFLASQIVGCTIKEVDFWGAKMKFSGIDLHAGANPIDQVDDRRGTGEFPHSNKGRY